MTNEMSKMPAGLGLPGRDGLSSDRRRLPCAGAGGPPRGGRIVILVFAALASLGGGVPDALAADPVARDVAPGVGLSFPSRNTQGESAVADLNGDGKLDIVLSGHQVFDWPILRGGNGTFSRVQALPDRGDRHGCVAADFGRVGGTGRPDGLLDLYCNHGACEGQCTKEFPNELFLQGANRTFSMVTNLGSSLDARKVAATWGVADPHGRGREAVAIDYDKDGLPDLALANEAPSRYPAPNRLFRNVGGRFQEVTSTVIRRESSSHCVEAADIDGDDWKDLLFCSSGSGSNKVLTYRNASGTFQDITSGTPYKGVEARQIEFSDVNGDNLPDLLIVAQTELTVRLNVSGNFPRVDFRHALSQGRDLAVGDVNLDGVPDIYVVQGNNDQYRDIMLIGEGGGTGFHTLTTPQVTAGDGEMVTTIPDWKGTGRAAFLVTNGRLKNPGPVQLITFSAS